MNKEAQRNAAVKTQEIKKRLREADLEGDHDLSLKILKEYIDHQRMICKMEAQEFSEMFPDSLSQVNRLRQQVKELENVLRCSKLLIAHWHEFGAEYDFSESVYWLDHAIKRYQRDKDEQE